MAATKKKKKPRRSAEAERHACFTKRTCQVHSNHRRDAREAGQWVDYDLEEFRRVVRRALAAEACHYCQGRVDEKNWSCDHRVPVSRAGGRTLANLVICCTACNMAKGALDYVEFRQLMNVLNQWSDPVRKHTLARLRAGGARMRSAPQASLLPPDSNPVPGGTNRKAGHPAPGDADAGADADADPTPDAENPS